MKRLLPVAALALAPALFLALQNSPATAQASARQVAGQTRPSPVSPGEIVANAPQADWVRIAPSDLLVMDLAPDSTGAARRVVIQLMPAPFSQGWVVNIRKLAAARFWDGLSIYRVQDNYVAQWGDSDADDPAKARALPAGLRTMTESEYVAPVTGRIAPSAAAGRDAYAPNVAVKGGWPIGFDATAQWPVHCYGMVGVGRDLPPNTGTGAELYVVIGHAPRHLDRNIALVGRVIEGIEHLSSLPRGTAGLGFYEKPEQRAGIRAIRLGNEVPDLPLYEYLSSESESFARYADARANRRDAFFIRPAGGADICNVTAPVRRAK